MQKHITDVCNMTLGHGFCSSHQVTKAIAKLAQVRNAVRIG